MSKSIALCTYNCDKDPNKTRHLAIFLAQDVSIHDLE